LIAFVHILCHIVTHISIYIHSRPTNHLTVIAVRLSYLVTIGAQAPTRSSATSKSTARPSCLVGVLCEISRERICWWLINYFYVLGPESYRIWRNNAKYTTITAFKVTEVADFGTSRKLICDFLVVINTNLPPIALFPSYGCLLVKFSLVAGECLTLMPSLGVIPC